MIDEVRRWWEWHTIARKQVRDIVKAMDGPGLNWRPLERDANSVAVIVTHLCGSEAFWFRQVLGGVNVGRNREAEFRARADRAQELLELIDGAEAQSAPVLEALTERDMGRVHDPGPDFPHLSPHSTREVLLRVITHTHTHLGHLEMTRQLWEARAAG